MARTITIAVAALALIGSSVACCTIPRLPNIDVPDIDFNVPTVEVGELREEEQSIPIGGAEEAFVELVFGGGELKLGAGSADQLFSGHFAYNVEQWAPEVTHGDGMLRIRQGGMGDENWGIPTQNLNDIRNEWELEFSPAIPLEMDIKTGAGVGRFDFTGLGLTTLDIDFGAGGFEVRFDERNAVEMERLTLDAGASSLNAVGIGNAGPAQVKVQGGAGEITLDFTGDWRGSANVSITAGIGELTLHLPDDLGVRVELKGGLSDVEAPGFTKDGDAYVNDRFGEAETELLIEAVLGVGSVRLIEVAN